MTLLLDTSILISIERKERGIVSKISEISKTHYQHPLISFISYFEFYSGLIEKNVKNKQIMIQFINKFNCLKASSATAQILAELKYKYEKKGITIPLADMIIASHAKEFNLTLVTTDKAFEKIEDINKIIMDLKQ